MAGYIGSKAAVTQVDGYTKTEAESRYANVSGDTFTGAVTGTDLTLSGGVYLGGTGAANKLEDYEEGTWTPTDNSGAGLSIVNNEASYTKIGRLCYIYAYISYPSTSDASTQSIGGLPFTAKGSQTYAQLTVRAVSDTVSQRNLTFQITTSNTVGSIHDGAAVMQNSEFSLLPLLISGVYEVA